ncbi:MAG: GIY-YIG nuclease family protein [Candidatus Marinimicrobia bacterium]|nr:GIY-YIG nuclease family protein [Candidatus Neomarinimicrobiota bacterium]
MEIGKTIQIFLPDGNPRSLKIAEITSRTVQAILIHRAKLDVASKRSELKNVSVYFLIGSTDEESKPLLYVGEAEDCLTRLKQQNKSKDFWNIAIAIVSKTQFFTKTHIKFLESYCYAEAEKAGRYKLENSTTPTLPFVSEPMEADLIDNFDTIKILVATLGYPIFDQIKKPKRQNILICKGKDAFAEGEYTEDGLIVFSGSKCNLKETQSAGPYVKNWRQKLIDDNILVLDGKLYRFQVDHIFSSPSTAAAVVLARRANGWIEWKFKDGKTLDEVKRKISN